MKSEAAEARRAHLLGVLRSSVFPVSTDELWKSCPKETCVYYDGSEGEVFAGYSNVYQNLCQLERRGLIVSLRPPESRSVFWAPILSLADARALLRSNA